MLSEAEFSKGLEALAHMYGRKLGTPRWRSIWGSYWKSCRRLELEAWEKGVDSALSASEGFPSVQRLRRHCGSLTGQSGASQARCEYCGLNPATFRTYCADCAYEDQEKSGLRPPARAEGGMEFYAEAVNSEPRRHQESVIPYLERIVGTAQELREGAQEERVPGQEG